MTSGDEVSGSVRNRLATLGDEFAGGHYRTEWSNIGADSVVTVTSMADQGDALTIRVSDDGALLDVNGAEAIEFSFLDDDDVDALLRVATAFYRGDLELVVGVNDGKCFGVRAGTLELTSSSGLIDRWRSGKRRVRPMR
jgi:hypothetical protein